MAHPGLVAPETLAEMGPMAVPPIPKAVGAAPSIPRIPVAAVAALGRARPDASSAFAWDAAAGQQWLKQ